MTATKRKVVQDFAVEYDYPCVAPCWVDGEESEAKRTVSQIANWYTWGLEKVAGTAPVPAAPAPPPFGLESELQCIEKPKETMPIQRSKSESSLIQLHQAQISMAERGWILTKSGLLQMSSISKMYRSLLSLRSAVRKETDETQNMSVRRTRRKRQLPCGSPPTASFVQQSRLYSIDEEDDRDTSAYTDEGLFIDLYLRSLEEMLVHLREHRLDQLSQEQKTFISSKLHLGANAFGNGLQSLPSSDGRIFSQISDGNGYAPAFRFQPLVVAVSIFVAVTIMRCILILMQALVRLCDLAIDQQESRMERGVLLPDAFQYVRSKGAFLAQTSQRATNAPQMTTAVPYSLSIQKGPLTDAAMYTARAIKRSPLPRQCEQFFVMARAILLHLEQRFHIAHTVVSFTLYWMTYTTNYMRRNNLDLWLARSLLDISESFYLALQAYCA